MTRTTAALRERLREGVPSRLDDGVVEALVSKIDPVGGIAYVLGSKEGLSRLDEDGEDIPAAGNAGSVLVATGQQVVIGVDTGDEPVVGAISLTEIKNVDYRAGRFRSPLFDVAVWGEGTYRFNPSERGDVPDLAAYVEAMSEVWDQVVASLGDARQHVSALGHRIETGDTEKASEHRAEARRLIESARDRIPDAPEPRDALEARVESVERELFRTALASRIERSETLRRKAGGHERSRRYAEAHEALRDAMDHLEGAFQLAVEHDFDRVEEVREALSDVKRRMEAVETKPLVEAKATHSRARSVDPERGVVLLHEALEHYRTALTAGWGVDRANFDGDPDDLREQIETVVQELIDARVDLAENLVSEADQQSVAADSRAATDRYNAAAQQLAAARVLANQYAAGDPDELGERLQAVRNREGSIERDEVEVV